MTHVIRAEMVASVHSVLVGVSEEIDVGATLVILESMKMEIPVLSEIRGWVMEVAVDVGDVVQEGDVIAVISGGPRPVGGASTT